MIDYISVLMSRVRRARVGRAYLYNDCVQYPPIVK